MSSAAASPELVLRTGATEMAREKVATTASLTGYKIKEEADPALFGDVPFEPEDGCVVAIEKTVLCGAGAVCRFMSLSSDKLFADDAKVDDRVEWAETELAPAVRLLVRAFAPGPVRAASQPAVIPGLDEGGLLLSAMSRNEKGEDVRPSDEAVEAIESVRSLMDTISACDKTVPLSLADVMIGVDARLALQAFGPGSYSGVSSSLLSRLPSKEDAMKTIAPVEKKRLEQEADESLGDFVARLFVTAIAGAFPGLEWTDAAVMRCANEKFGDYQCNAPMSIFKALKKSGSTVASSPRSVGEAIARAVPDNDVLGETTVAPAGFINTVVSDDVLSSNARSLAVDGPKPPPLSTFGGKRKVLVDFSSPNIAKEMHVGHLRSTIIGDTICRVMEFCGHEVLRVNHVGDWGTQFGMLISHMETAYPNFTQDPPNITDLTTFYKNAKKRFDEDEPFKKQSRQTVVDLQAGDPRCREIWKLLCDISRKEFDKVYARLDIHLEEYGESYYNGMIPSVIEKLEAAGMVTYEDGKEGQGATGKAAIIKLPNHSFPLIIRKADGGFGYDSTDMAAVHHRLLDLDVDWAIYVTDSGQQEHFYMVFEAAEAAGWTSQKKSNVQLRHLGFGVVQGIDGKRFKTRSGDTVRLVDLLDEAVVRMRASLRERVDEGRCSLTDEEVKHAAAVVGYGAVKYADLHQHPSTNYKFSYDKMLSTSGNTAVYLLFAHARLASIVRRVKDEKGVDAAQVAKDSLTKLSLAVHPKERQLCFELTQFSAAVVSVANELVPSRLCDYLYRLSTKFTEFVTECKVMGDPRQNERLVLCEATGVVMRRCLDLLGIKYLMRI